MTAMLQDRFTSVLNVKTREELLGAVVRFAEHVEFATVSAMTVVDHADRDTEFAWVDNTPTAYRATFESMNKARRDPVMQHCKRSGIPIVWNQRTYVSAAKGEMWEEQAVHGYRTGIALALHLPRGLHFFVGVDRDEPLPGDRAEVDRLTAELCLFATHAQDAALRLLLPDPRPGFDDPKLTPRELESLRWTMEGKTAWEVGRILAISELTAARHINNATHKLGCVNKIQAVLKALRFGLIR